MGSSSDQPESPVLVARPIGVVHSPYRERQAAPRQPRVTRAVEGSIELFPMNGLDHALEDLNRFSHIWVLFWFHLAAGFRPKVLPPRSTVRRGVFATRSPYRPNPIGMSAVELIRVEGNILSIRDLDMIDQTPVLDIKPYVRTSDALPDTPMGWLEDAPRDSSPHFDVVFSLLSREQLASLFHLEPELEERIVQVLSAGAEPHAYRRIKRRGEEGTLAHKAWRVDFIVDGARVEVVRLRSGFRQRDLDEASNPELLMHRQFIDRFGRE